MVPKEEALEDGNDLSSASGSESSDSYSYLLRDFDSPSNRITEEWEAIERTLYQESGKHVTDPTLLKECKLWRETFPHIRVKGTGIKTIKDSGCGEENKDVGDDNNLVLSKINEKREKIKKTVVSQIVERLINKLSLNTGVWESHPEVTNKIKELNEISNMKSLGVNQEKESYFERGKGSESRGILKYDNSKTNNKDSLLGLFDDFEYEPNKTRINADTKGIWSGSNYSRAKEPITVLAKNEEIMRSSNFKFEISEKRPSNRIKNEKPSNSISNINRPFEATKKIDRKYEAMLERILESKGIYDGKRISKSKSCGHSLEKKREPNSTKRTKELPRINSFTNNWLSRAEEHLSGSYGYKGSINRNFLTGNTTRNLDKQYVSQSFRKPNSVCRLNEKLMEELGKEMNEFKISSNKDCEEINLERPKLHSRYNQSNKAKTQKSLSCSDLPKKNMKPKTNRILNNTLEKGKSELLVKSGGKRTTKNTGRANIQLPPIETSIICTEILSRQNVPVKSFTNKH